MPINEDATEHDNGPYLPTETPLATLCASLSALIMMAYMLFFLWLLSDDLSGEHKFNAWTSKLLERRFGAVPKPPAPPQSELNIGPVTPQGNNAAVVNPYASDRPTGVLLLAFIGGAIGGIVNELRSFLVWHAEKKQYGARFIWKGIMAPWVGGSLALFAVAIISGGVAMVGASFGTGESPHQVFSVFAIGAMAGYGSRDVSKWLDSMVKQYFNPQQSPRTLNNNGGAGEPVTNTAAPNTTPTQPANNAGNATNGGT